MFDAINKQFNAAKRNAREEQFILESVMDVEEVLPGSEEDIDDVVDSDSVPDEVYKKVDEMLDKMVDAADYDDTEAEELLDDDDDISDEELDAVITEAIEGDVSEMDESIFNRSKKAPESTHKTIADRKAEHERDERNAKNTELREKTKEDMKKDMKDFADSEEEARKEDARRAMKNENTLEYLRTLATGEAK